MSLARTYHLCAVGFCLVLATALPSFGQSDAQQALDDARQAFAEGQFERARDLLITAAQTDPDNPDIRLLLGKSHYQLGQVEEAIKAWRATLKLAPQQAYAKRMIQVLTNQAVDVDSRLEIVAALLRDRVLTPVPTELARLRSTSSLSQGQHVKLLQYDAEYHLAVAKPQQALRALGELSSRYADQLETPQVQLLLARARVSAGGPSLEMGLNQLKTLASEQAETPWGAAAELELIAFRLKQHEPIIDTLLAWIKAHSEHPQRVRAREELIAAIKQLFAVTAQGQAAKPKDPLSDADQQALTAAVTAYATRTTASEADALTRMILNHLEQHYAARQALQAVETGLDRLEQIQMPPSSQRRIEAARRLHDQRSAEAQYKAIAAKLAENIDQADQLTDWIEQHSQHPQIMAARQTLLQWYLDAASRQKGADKNAPLAESDLAAFQVAAEIFAKTERSADALQLTQRLTAHVNHYYTNRGAMAASADAFQRLLAIPLPVASQVHLLQALATVQKQTAITKLTEAATEQRIVAGPLPDELQAVLATYQKINDLVPATPSWQNQAELAAQVNGLSVHLAWPDAPAEPKATQAWALEIALPVIAADDQTKAVHAAAATINQVVDELAALHQQSADGLAVAVHDRLLEVLALDSPMWITAMHRRTDLLASHGQQVFQRNRSAGRLADNNQLNPPQKELIETLKRLVTRRPSQAGVALAKLHAILGPYLAAGHYQVAETSYESLHPALPQPQQFETRLIVLQLWIQQVVQRDQRKALQGFRIDERLDPQLAKALHQAYQLQRGIPAGDPRLEQVRQVTDTIVRYYHDQEMFDVAEQAIKTKSEQPVAEADKYAQWQLAALKLDLAHRQLARSLANFRGRESIELTPAFETAMTAFEQLIQQYPADPFTSKSLEQLMGIGQLFESHHRGQVAASVYRRIEAFAAGIDRLGQAEPGQATATARAAYAAAFALHEDALRTQNHQLEKQPEDAPPIRELSEGFVEAVAAYQDLIRKYPDSPLVKSALQRTLAVGLAHAKHGGWDVAGEVYQQLLQQDLPLRQPERIELARAMCQLGKVMPGHAQQILETLSAQPYTQPQPGEGQTLLAGSFMDGILRERKDLYQNENGQPSVAIVGERLADQIAANQKEIPGGASAGQGRGVASGPGSSSAGGRGGSGRAERDADLLAAVHRQQGTQAVQIARLRASRLQFGQPNQQAEAQQAQQQAPTVTGVPALSDAELARRQRVLNTAYEMLQTLRTRYRHTPTAAQARGEILIIINHWREISQWERAAQLATRFLNDNPSDSQLPTIRQEIAHDYLAWSAQAVDQNSTKQQLLETVNKRFDKARDELNRIVADFPDHDAVKQQAQWDIANSYLTQARVVARLSPTLARGQYVRSTNELIKLAQRYHDHPQIGTIPQMMWDIAAELASQGYHDEAITVWNTLSIHHPFHPLGHEAALRIAQTYQSMNQPLRSVEAYVELNFSRGGNDQAMQQAVYQVATQLVQQKRWVEALHVLETFVDSFPQHPQAGQALATIGQIHQTNEAWEDAIAAYDRVITEYSNDEWVKQARWSIAECTINLSRWRDAIETYSQFAQAYAQDAKAAVASQRIDILKDLDRYQRVVDEKEQRKSFDAQYQIGAIMRDRLSNPIKSIIEFRKVADRWPNSHLADDAYYQIGVSYLGLGETEKAREALLAVAEKYPNSPLADDALFMVGQSYENEAQRIAAVTRDTSVAEANDMAQKLAYQRSQFNRRSARGRGNSRVSELKKQGKFAEAEEQVARNAANFKAFDYANAQVIANWASQEAQVLTAAQLADRQDKVNAALRKAVAAFRKTASFVSGDKGDEALLRMAQIYDLRLKDADAAMQTWLEITKQFSGTAVAEDASWKIAKYYEQHGEYAKAIEAYQAFLRNYRNSPQAGAAQAAIAEDYEHLGRWVDAMDAYTNYLNNYPDGPLVARAREQINWIKTYRL